MIINAFKGLSLNVFLIIYENSPTYLILLSSPVTSWESAENVVTLWISDKTSWNGSWQGDFKSLFATISEPAQKCHKKECTDKSAPSLSYCRLIVTFSFGLAKKVPQKLYSDTLMHENIHKLSAEQSQCNFQAVTTWKTSLTSTLTFGVFLKLLELYKENLKRRKNRSTNTFCSQHTNSFCLPAWGPRFYLWAESQLKQCYHQL